MKRVLASMFVLLVLAACGKSESDATGNGDGGSGNEVLGSKPADANGCCPRDTTQSGCMYLGGHTDSDSCPRTCDFFCSTNWRVETDEHGCEGWRYDMRAPAEGENSACMKPPSGFDAGIDAPDESDASDSGDASSD